MRLTETETERERETGTETEREKRCPSTKHTCSFCVCVMAGKKNRSLGRRGTSSLDETLAFALQVICTAYMKPCVVHVTRENYYTIVT